MGAEPYVDRSRTARWRCNVLCTLLTHCASVSFHSIIQCRSLASACALFASCCGTGSGGMSGGSRGWENT